MEKNCGIFGKKGWKWSNSKEKTSIKRKETFDKDLLSLKGTIKSLEEENEKIRKDSEQNVKILEEGKKPKWIKTLQKCRNILTVL